MSERDQLRAAESLLFDFRLRRQPVTGHVDDSQTNSVDDIQTALEQDVQSYLTDRRSCCNVVLPIAFERADPKSWFNPKFDSPALEEQYLINLFPHMRMLYRFTLSYILINTIVWDLYFWLGDFHHNFLISLLWRSMILAIMSIIALLFTNTDMYRVHHHKTSVLTSIVICATGLSLLCFTGNTFSPLGHFALCLEIILLIYSGLPMILWIRAFIAISYSIVFETLSSLVPGTLGVHLTDPLYYNRIKILRILLQFSVHLMASHVLIMKTVRMRETFMKMGQNLLVRRQLEMEKKLNENMIHSVMPPKVADMLLNEDGFDHPEVKSKYMRPRRSILANNVKLIFRPFHIRTMNNVSILFADIVGFTSMSSKKTAEELVEILNDLFERFDNLCTFSGCEKISTLGDCYCCVSGCPEPRPDHAFCCVEMGLDIIYAMRYYEAQRHEGVKMRVGVHTGTVFFGIVGTRRVKFDVWSNDVELADLIQSTGKPELVRISEVTLNHLGGAYLLEESEKVMGHRTYFVMGRKNEQSQISLKEYPHRVSSYRVSYNNDDTLTPISIEINCPPGSPFSQISDLSPQLSTYHQRFLSLKIFDSAQEDEYLSNAEKNRKLITNLEIEENKTNARQENGSLLHLLRKIDDFRRTAPSENLLNSRASQIPPNGTAITVETPLLMETTNPISTLYTPQRHGQTPSLTPDGSYSSVIIDVLSGISQSRSDISLFVPPGSFRSQNMRSGQEDPDPEPEDSDTDTDEAETQSPTNVVNPMTQGTARQSVQNPLEHCLQHLRKHSDIQFIRCVRDNAKSLESHILNPPLKRCTLFFESEQMEREFRSKAHRAGNENEIEGQPMLATPLYNTYLDIFVVIVVYFCVATSLLLMAPHTLKYPTCIAIFSIFTAIQFFALVFFTRHMRLDNTNKMSYGNRIFAAISSWYKWHICLGILMAMPVALVIIHYALFEFHSLHTFEYHYGFLIFVCIVQFCNFTQLNFWMRNILALVAAMVLLFIVHSHIADSKLGEPKVKKLAMETKWIHFYSFEIIVDLLLLLIFVWLLNRELEIGYRLTFFGNAVVTTDKIRVQEMKNQVEILLQNIMPKHVAEQLKNTAKYSENHQNVAIIFASIINFNEICDESEEHLRVLNELIGDFDELLSRPEFKCVEKIKTIGSTFMAASGLNPRRRCVKNHHILALMEFSKSMQLVVDTFNMDLLEFELVLRIGFNVGDVTAGVLGTSKLHYDIWGDAVNVASRMNTTGVSSKIQVGKNCLPYLEDRYEFESRGEIDVKGKGKMEMFLYKTDKPYSTEDDCGNECGLKYLLNNL